MLFCLQVLCVNVSKLLLPQAIIIKIIIITKGSWNQLMPTLVMCISTSKHMVAHAFSWSKTIKNARKLSKSMFFIIRTRDLCKAHAKT